MGIAASQTQDRYAIAAGTDTYTASFSPPVASYETGKAYLILFTNANTGASTLDIDGLGPIPLVKDGGTALASGDINTGQIYECVYDGADFQVNIGGGAGGTVTSVGLSMPSAFNVTNSPVTTSGTLTVTGAGLTSQYVRGDGSLANFPNSTGGGASVSYYLNGGTSQGTFGGVTYYEMSKTAVVGSGVNFTIASNGYIASFITDAGDPNLINIPSGNWNFELFLSASSAGGTPSFYVELYKYDGASFTLISTGSAAPESINNGTAVDLYTTALAVPTTTLALTDRLAVRIYINNSGRTITLHTQDNTLCQIITTFTTGITALNGLTEQVQTFATGTTGTDFNISSATSTHTFNLPVASATNTGKLSDTDWSTFNNKVSSVGATAPITSSGGTTPTISTSMATNKLIGRTTAGTGVMEEISVGTGLTLSAGTLSNSDPASGVTLTSAGGTETLVNDGSGPSLATKGLSSGTGISLSGSATAVTITNSDPGSAVSLTSAGVAAGTQTLVNDGTGPSLAVKGVVAGTGIQLVTNATDVTITNTDPASAVTLTSAGGTQTLVNDGTGPALATKGLTSGNGISMIGGATEVTITNASPASSVTLTSAGGTETLVNDGTGPDLATKGLTAGTGISLSGAATAVTITNSSPASSVTLTSAGGTETLVNDGTGPAIATKGLTAGTGITLTGAATAVTIANSGVTSVGATAPITSSGGATPTISTSMATSRVIGRTTAGTGVMEELTLTQVLDLVGSAAQGDILYRDASGWTRLGAGTAGQVLQTNGTGANPSWVNSWQEVTWGSDVSTTSTSNQDITGASFSLAANSSYLVEFNLKLGSSASNGIGIGFSLPTGATGDLIAISRTTSETVQSMVSTQYTGDTTSGNAYAAQIIVGAPLMWTVRVVTSSTAGTFQLRFASKNVANTATIYYAASYMKYKKIA